MLHHAGPVQHDAHAHAHECPRVFVARWCHACPASPALFSAREWTMEVAVVCLPGPLLHLGMPLVAPCQLSSQKPARRGSPPPSVRPGCVVPVSIAPMHSGEAGRRMGAAPCGTPQALAHCCSARHAPMKGRTPTKVLTRRPPTYRCGQADRARSLPPPPPQGSGARACPACSRLD